MRLSPTVSGGVESELPPAAPAAQVESALRRYLLYGLLPAWFVLGIADGIMHRKTHTERTSGTPESLIHALMMAEVGADFVRTEAGLRRPADLALLATGANPQGALAADAGLAMRDGRVRVTADMRSSPADVEGRTPW